MQEGPGRHGLSIRLQQEITLTKITLLDQMRMQRDQREGPEIKELKEYNRGITIRLAALQRLHQRVIDATAQLAFKPMMDRIGCELADALLRYIYKEVAKNPPKGPQDYYIQIPYNHLSHLDSDSTLSLILQQYRQQKWYPQIEFRGVSSGNEKSTYRVMEVFIKIPELNYREVVEV
jgi:hypothetical protein